MANLISSMPYSAIFFIYNCLFLISLVPSASLFIILVSDLEIGFHTRFMVLLEEGDWHRPLIDQAVLANTARPVVVILETY